MKIIRHSCIGVLTYSLLLIFLVSCSSLPLLQPHATQVITDENWKDVRENYIYTPGTISIEADLNKEAIERNAAKELALLLNELNGKIQGTGENCRIDIGLREADFMKDYQPVKTLALTMTVSNDSGKKLASYFYSEESKDSFYSSSYLFKCMKKGFGKLF